MTPTTRRRAEGTARIYVASSRELQSRLAVLPASAPTPASECTQRPRMALLLEDTLASYKKNGFAIIREFIPRATCDALRAVVDPALDAAGIDGASIGGMDRWGEGRFDELGHALLNEYFVARSELLDFVELLMGPFVQLDTLQLIGREPPQCV